MTYLKYVTFLGDVPTYDMLLNTHHGYLNTYMLMHSKELMVSRNVKTQ